MTREELYQYLEKANYPYEIKYRTDTVVIDNLYEINWDSPFIQCYDSRVHMQDAQMLSIASDALFTAVTDGELSSQETKYKLFQRFLDEMIANIEDDRLQDAKAKLYELKFIRDNLTP